MRWSFISSIGFIVLFTSTIPTLSGWFDTKHDLLTDNTRENLTILIRQDLDVLLRSATSNATRNLISLAYSLTGLYLIGKNKVSDEKDQYRYTKGSFACQLALGLGLSGFGYYVFHSAA